MENNTWGKRRYANRYLSSERTDFPHLASHVEMYIVKMVNLGKEIENDKK